MKNIALSQKIKELRMITGTSQEELALTTELSLRTIQRIENGETQPRGDSLKRLALALGVPTEELARLMVPEEGGQVAAEPEYEKSEAAGLPENKGFLLLLHLSALSYWLIPGLLLVPVLGILSPLVLWLLKKDVFLGVQGEGRKILNFQISWFLLFMLITGNIFITKMLHIKSVLDHGTLFRLLIGLYLFNAITVIVNIIRVGQDKAGIYRPAIPFMPNA